MVVEFGEPLRLFLADIGDVQGVAVLPKHRPVVLPGHAVVRQPAVPLEHTFCEDDIHIADAMDDAPDVGDGAGTAADQEAVEVHLMEHPLDVGQADLERGVDVFAAQHLVDLLGEPGRDETLAVKTVDGDVRCFLHPVISPHAVLRAVVLHGDDGNKTLRACQVVHDDDPVGTVDIYAVDANAAGQHQTVVDVELGELAIADGHVHHDPAAHRLIEVGPNEGQLPLPAHAAGALKCQIAVLTGSKVQPHAVGPEHILRLPLALQMFRRGVPVKDTVEVHVEDHVGQVGDGRSVVRLGEAVAAQDAHGLEEQRVAVLLVERAVYSAPLGGGAVQMKGPDSVCLLGVAGNRPGGQLVDSVAHTTTSEM